MLMKVIAAVLGLFTATAGFGGEWPGDSIPSCRVGLRASGFADGVIDQSGKKDTTKQVIRFRCRATLQQGNEPLFVIDGIPAESKEIADLNVNDIESIHVLKNAAAAALYGCRANKGVIVITTKYQRAATFIVKDFLDGSGVPGATVSLISTDKKDTLLLVSNEKGRVESDRLKRGIEYAILVTSVGYKPLDALKSKKGCGLPQELLLERDEKTCPEVVVSATQCYRTCRLYCQCPGIIINTHRLKVPIKYNESETGYKIYPNSVLKGGMTTVEVASETAQALQFQVLSLDGRIMMSQSHKAVKGINRFSIVMDSRWASGTYIVQLLYEDGKPAPARKVLVR
jgi:TonB-dependent SusC/RagA subfamily outer membrane receptor